MPSFYWHIYYGTYWAAALLVLLAALIAVLLTYLHDRLFLKDSVLMHAAWHTAFQAMLWLVLSAGAFAVLWMTVLGRDWGTIRVVYLVPGRLVSHYLKGDSEALRTLLMNVGVFTPFGAFLGTLFAAFQHRRFSVRRQLMVILLVSAVFSCILEAGQYLAACGETDIEDLLTNTLGGGLGFGVYSLEDALLRKLFRAESTDASDRGSAGHS